LQKKDWIGTFGAELVRVRLIELVGSRAAEDEDDDDSDDRESEALRHFESRLLVGRYGNERRSGGGTTTKQEDEDEGAVEDEARSPAFCELQSIVSLARRRAPKGHQASNSSVNNRSMEKKIREIVNSLTAGDCYELLVGFLIGLTFRDVSLMVAFREKTEMTSFGTTKEITIETTSASASVSEIEDEHKKMTITYEYEITVIDLDLKPPGSKLFDGGRRTEGERNIYALHHEKKVHEKV
jgi:hypothetical protein